MRKQYKNSIEEIRAVKENMAKKAGYDVWKLLGYKQKPASLAPSKSHHKTRISKTGTHG